MAVANIFECTVEFLWLSEGAEHFPLPRTPVCNQSSLGSMPKAINTEIEDFKEIGKEMVAHGPRHGQNKLTQLAWPPSRTQSTSINRPTTPQKFSLTVRCHWSLHAHYW
jgi:hypothetical protein